MARGPSPRGEASRRARPDSEAPWLEEAEPDEDVGGSTLVGRSTLWLILLGLLALVSLVAAGVFMVARADRGDIDALPPGAEIPLLRDPGPWKVAPEGPGVDGVPVEGQDQILFGTGVGADPESRIALDALPEEPVERMPAPRQGPPTDLLPESFDDPAPAPTKAPAQPQPGPRPEVTVVPRVEAPRPAVAAPAVPATPANEAKADPAAPAATLVQLGAFSSDARARAAWKNLAGRFSYLEGLAPVIVPVTTDGRTLYRLRADAGSPAAAADICGRLKVAGESCAIVGR